MVEPLSIVAGIVSLTKVAVQSALQTKQFIDRIQGAPHALKNLSSDLNALYLVLGTLQAYLDNPRVNADPVYAAFMPMLSEPLSNCVSAFQDITKLINPFIKSTGDPNQSEWRKLKWTFREREVMNMQTILISYKHSLDIAIAVANLSSSTNDFQHLKQGIRGLENKLNSDRASFITNPSTESDGAGTDHGYTLRKFLLDAESVMDEPILNSEGYADGESLKGTPPKHEGSQIVGGDLHDSREDFNLELAAFTFPFQATTLAEPAVKGDHVSPELSSPRRFKAEAQYDPESMKPLKARKHDEKPESGSVAPSPPTPPSSDTGRRGLRLKTSFSKLPLRTSTSKSNMFLPEISQPTPSKLDGPKPSASGKIGAVLTTDEDCGSRPMSGILGWNEFLRYEQTGQSQASLEIWRS